MQAELFFSFFSVFKVLLLNISKTYSDSVPKNNMQFTLGMTFLGVLGKFYRNRKGLRMIGSSSKNVCWLQHTLHRNAIFKFYID